MADNTNSPKDGAAGQDLAALQNEIRELKEAVGHATSGLRLYRSEEDVVARIRQRFTYALIVVAVLSFFGIQGIAYVIIDQQWGAKLDDRVTAATVAVAQAETATAQAKDAAAKAKEITDIARGKAEAVSDKLEKITTQISDVDKKLENDIKAATDNVRELATKTAATIQKQLASVEDQVSKLSSRAGVNPRVFQQKQQTLRQNYGSTKKAFETNSKFSVRVYSAGPKYITAARKISSALTGKGYKSVTSTWLHKIDPRKEVPSGKKWSNTPIVSIIANKKISRLPGKLSEISQVIRKLMPSAKIVPAIGTKVQLSRTLRKPRPATFRLMVGNWQAKVTN